MKLNFYKILISNEGSDNDRGTGDGWIRALKLLDESSLRF